MTPEFNPNTPVEITSENNGHRQRMVLGWTRRDGRPRHMVDWVFSGNMRNLFVLILAVVSAREIL